MKRCLVAALVAMSAGIVVMIGAPVRAESVKIQPLQYKTELKKAEKKKGFVDITNPSNETVNLKLYVNGFSQVDKKGSLTFFKNEQIERGLLLDYDAVKLDPRQTLRLYFLADGTKLPTGDVFAAIFAETKPVQQEGAATAVRVGTLVMITNQTPGPRKAEIAELSIPFLQIGATLDGTIAVKNPAPKNAATGFFPDIGVEVAPWGGKAVYKGPLVFAGNTRTFDFHTASNALGFYTIKVTANTAEKTKLVFLITGWWRVVAPLLVLLAASAIIWAVKYYYPRKKHAVTQ